MKIISVTRENLAQEHICCAITEKKSETCVADKKAWMNARFDDGLVFQKLDVRGKVFIEYIPAEKAWHPVDAPSYMHIDCLWVSGQFKGHGYANQLLDACIADAKEKGKVGLTILSSAKKKPFLADGGFLRHRGFRVADTAEPFFQLLYLPFEEDVPAPSFLPQAKQGETNEQGIVLYYADQCPFAHTYAGRIAEAAAEHGRSITLHRLQSAEEARQSPAVWTTYSLFYDGRFVTNEILSVSKFEKMMETVFVR